MKRALTIRKTWMVATPSQRRSLIHLPDSNRSSVRANDVLLHTEARMERVPMKLPSRPMAGRLSSGIAWTCLPRPLEVAMVTMKMEVLRTNCLRVSVVEDPWK